MSLLENRPEGMEFPNYTGYTSIQFRNDHHNSRIANTISTNYVLNSHGDNWFRVNDASSNADGYGLMIKSLKITGPHQSNRE